MSSNFFYIVTSENDLSVGCDKTYMIGKNTVSQVSGSMKGDCNFFFVPEREQVNKLVGVNSKWIRKVYIPPGADKIKDTCRNYYLGVNIQGIRTNIIHVSDKEELYTIDNLIKFNLSLYDQRDNQPFYNCILHTIVENITKDDDLIKCIKWIKSNIELVGHDEQLEFLLMDSAMYLNNTDIINDLKNNPLNFKDVKFAVKKARTRAMMDYLNSKFPHRFKGRFYNLDRKILENEVEVVQWWLDSGYEVDYTKDAITNKISVDMLQCLQDSKLGLKYTYGFVDELCEHIWKWNFTDPDEIVEKLEWCKNNTSMNYTKIAVDNLSYSSMRFPEMIKVLDWWKDSGLEFKYSNNALDWVLYEGLDSTQIITWWKNNSSTYPLKYTKSWYNSWKMGNIREKFGV